MRGSFNYTREGELLRKLAEGDPQPGGKAVQEGVTPTNVDQAELEKGVRVESEHTSDPVKAMQIALDHLAEIPDYYTRLKKMEEGAKAEGSVTQPPAGPATPQQPPETKAASILRRIVQD